MEKENIWCVYMHTNKANNKKYIGISSNVKKRWAGSGSAYYDQVFGLAIQKYGWNNFKHEILFDSLSQKDACKYEQELIEKYQTYKKKFGYNRSKGGDSGSYGAYNTQINKMVHVFQYDLDGSFVKEHISISAAARELTPEYAGRNSCNITTCCNGKRLTALGYRWFYTYQGEKIAPIKSTTERIVEGESKKVYQYSLNGDFIQEYKSVTYAKQITGVKGIGNCARGEIKSSGGYQWFYKYMGEKTTPYVKSSNYEIKQQQESQEHDSLLLCSNL